MHQSSLGEDQRFGLSLSSYLLCSSQNYDPTTTTHTSVPSTHMQMRGHIAVTNRCIHRHPHTQAHTLAFTGMSMPSPWSLTCVYTHTHAHTRVHTQERITEATEEATSRCRCFALGLLLIISFSFNFSTSATGCRKEKDLGFCPLRQTISGMVSWEWALRAVL